METVALTIDGKPVTVEKGRTVLQAAIASGIGIPYYCYHPGLGVDGSCRVCIVKIEKMPKLQTACSTPVADGMVVYTQTPDVVEGRQGVFEFLLLNHPLDCPVCDKGGECPLQDFSYTFGPPESRTHMPRRVFDGEGVGADVDFGPTLMLNRNRCILCTRCVRFMNEIDGDAQINIIARGAGSEIATFREEGVHSLISGNLMDVCPVGAITTKDYRFKSRPWDNLQAVDTTCTFCSKGCSTTVWLKAKPEWAKGARMIRITPRFNPDVNGYWMCDIGRFEYHWIESDRRLTHPMLRKASGGFEAVPWSDALAHVAARLVDAGPDSVAFLASAHASLEELAMLNEISRPERLVVTWRYREKQQPARTRFRVPPVDAPNLQGARDLGLVPPAQSDDRPGLETLRAAVESGAVRALFVLDPGPAGSIGEASWIADARRRGALSFLAVQGVLQTDLADAADAVLPGTAPAEKDAAYTNESGRIQAAVRALVPPGEAREDWIILRDLAEALGIATFSTAAGVRSAIAQRLAGGRPAYAALASLSFSRPLAARHWLQTSNPSERWKWDFMFQDLPPVKFEAAPDTLPRAAAIPLRKIE